MKPKYKDLVLAPAASGCQDGPTERQLQSDFCINLSVCLSVHTPSGAERHGPVHTTVTQLTVTSLITSEVSVQ
jgi:hypothetical protein